MTDMTDAPLSPSDYERIARHLAGEETPGERADTAQWMTEVAERQRVAELWDVVEHGRGAPAVWNLESTWGRLHSSMVQDAQRDDELVGAPANVLARLHARRVSRRRASRIDASWKRRVAPAMAALLVLGAFGLVAVRYTHRTRGLPAPLATYVTGNAERARVELRDGTIVTLDAGSCLSISKDFGLKNRSVHLKYGQAYFQVVHAAGAPFIVNVAGRQATVLGTSFGVRAYSRDTVRVAVHDGKVAFENVVLHQSDVATATTGAPVLVAHAQAVDALFGFVQGRLILDDVTLRAAVPELDRWYDVDIRFGDSAAASRHLSAVLLSGSARDLADNLHAIVGVHVVRNGRTLTLYTREQGR